MKRLKSQVKYAVDPIVEFPKVEKILYKVAWNFSQNYPITFEECKSEAYYAFMKACEDYKPERGQKFSSWAYYWAWCKLKDLVMRRSAEPLDFMEINEELLGAAPPAQIESLELIDDLSADAKEIISLLVESPAELISLGAPMTAKQLMKKVKEYLVEECGKDKKVVEAAHKELQTRFQTAWAT